MSLEQELKEQAIALGFQGVGITGLDQPLGYEFFQTWLDEGFAAGMGYMSRQADLRQSATKLLPSARSVIAVRLNYSRPASDLSEKSIKVARYALGRDYHKVMRAKLRKLSAWVVEAHPEAEVRSCVDSAPILERAYAHQAGLGWFGKNTCLIDSKTGSWFFIGLLLTSLELQADEPSVGGCGTCDLCIRSCPTGAIVKLGNRWAVDSRRCISYLTIEHRGEFTSEESEAIGDWTFGCDVCQEVCPFNQTRPSQPARASAHTEPDFEPRSWPSPADVQKAGFEEWDEWTKGTAVRRAGLEGLKRNVSANLKNRSKE